MDWPARSPDLNPIEHIWDFLGRRLAARTLPPVTIRELRLALQDEWAAMPQQLIDTLILSMGRRCETCLATWCDSACDEHESLYERRDGGHPLYLQPSQRKWTCCCSVVWGMIPNEAATESSNVHSGASEAEGPWILQSHD
ncbi:hypothetical protein TNCV_1327161 [Trichonephila clavipes]|nr:hypothetical protein TNCV_1327161 [Trichonephila clavipes]